MIALVIYLLTIMTTQSNAAETTSQSLLFSNVCQSGIREDFSNYIYCARRSLNEIPLFSKNNVVYDELVLSDNRIVELTKDSFSRIKVKKIYLNGNPLKRIDQLTFAKLENHLEELWLDADTTISSNNFLIQPATTNGGIPRAVLNLRNLNTLKLKGFLIKQLENSILKKLNRIEILSLQFCSIEQIDSLAFDGLKNSLKELYLDGNLLQQIPTSALLTVGFKSLKVLSLSQNIIKTISSDSFGFVALNFLDNNDFNPLRHLTKLDISYNGLKVIDPEAFIVFNSLETLLLQNNEINSFNLRFLQHLSLLKELNLDFNVISRLTSNIFINSTRLQYLTLQGNSVMFSNENEDTSASIEVLKTEQSVFNGLISLQRLNLARNGVKYLPKDLFKPLNTLKSLLLDKNPIENFDQSTFSGLEFSLMNISLQNTKLKSKHLISLKNLIKLERVKLGFNDLDELDWSIFTKMHLSLTNLDVQNNQIDSIYDSACEQADTNGIFFLPNKDCNNLMENLVELDLSNNKLCSFNSKLLTKMPKLKNLGLSQNPLYCDCNLLPLYDWVKHKFEKDMLSFIQWQCELPETDDSDKLIKKQRRRQLTSLSATDFQCLNTSISKCRPTSINTVTNKVLITSTLKQEKSTTEEIISRISNVNLKSIFNSILVTWELDNFDKSTNDIQGFKLTYNQLFNLLDTSAPSTTSMMSPILVSFLTDKNQRQFKIDNLKFNTHYSVCVSLIRFNHNNGYDKYCRDIELTKPQEKSIKTSKTNATSSLLSPSVLVPSSSTSPAISSNLQNSNFISGLMITILSLLISFILGLLVFFYFFIRKCRLNQNGKMRRSKSSMSNSINSSRRDYTGAILTTSNPHTFDSKNQQKIINYCGCNSDQKCDTESSSTSSISPNNNNFMQVSLNGAACSTLARAFTIGDTSTVSSTLSSVNNTTNNSGICIKNQKLFETAKRNQHSAQSNLANTVVMANNLPSDVVSTSPTSFTHYIIQQYNNQQQHPQSVALSYVPYEVYNCFQNNNCQQQQQQQFIPQQMINNSKTIPKLNNNNNNIVNNVEHVYCEIPSTLQSKKPMCNNQIIFYNQNNQIQKNTAQSLLVSSSALSNTNAYPTHIVTANNNNFNFSNNTASNI